MIHVERRLRFAAQGEEERLLEALEERPGAWMGCDVEVEGLYSRHSAGCVDPVLAFYLDGRQLRIVALKPVGAGLLDHIRPLAAFREVPGGLDCSWLPDGIAPHPAVRLLRSFLRLFQPAPPELGLYGTFAFDYFRLADADALQEDGRRRLVLYFPDRVLTRDAGGTRIAEFGFSDVRVDTAWQVPDIPRSAREALEPELTAGRHAERVGQGIELLRRGELVSLVLSQRFRRQAERKASEAFRSLRASNPYPAMFFFNLGGDEKLFGASPDVQVRADGEFVESAPVCGTVRRGDDPLGDVDQAAFLLNSEKEAAALDVCVDSDFNDKASVCVPGSVELVAHRRIHQFSTIVHAISHTRGKRRLGVDALDLLLSHAAPATVAGVPKERAVSAIERIEGDWRGWYAGAAARLGCDGSAEIYTILRAAHLRGHMAEVRTGGNILVDSDPIAEEEESRLKAQTLFRVLSEEPSATERRSRAPCATAACRIRILDFADPFKARLLDALARIGAIVDAQGQITLVTGSRSEPRIPVPEAKVLAIGEAGYALLAEEGAPWDAGAAPRQARSVQAKVQQESFLAGISPASVGVYRQRGMLAGTLPKPWQCIAWDDDGQALAAMDPGRRRCVLLFRPDSILSSRNSTGDRMLAAALNWLSR